MENAEGTMKRSWKRWLHYHPRRKVFVFSLLIITFFLQTVKLTYNGSDPICLKSQNNFVYIKMIKCASETLAAVFRRYAFHRNLSIVLPLEKFLYLGWPYPLDEFSYRPPKTDKGFNILVDHTVFNESVMDQLMQPDNVYITSIREPYKQFKSMFNYYSLRGHCNISSSVLDPVTEYLHNLEKYEAVYKSEAARPKRICIPNGFSMSRNLMAFNLGFPAGKPDGAPDLSDSEEAIGSFLARIESRFRLVLLVDFFDESMVLLRRLMCWGIKDVLYSKLNEGKYATLPSTLVARDKIEEENVAIYRNWSRVDYRLYDHFKKIFWEKVSVEGLAFYRELAYYKKINRLVNEICAPIKSYTSRVIVKGTLIEGRSYGDDFVVDTAYCKIFKSTMLREVKNYYDKLPYPYDFDVVIPQKKFC